MISRLCISSILAPLTLLGSHALADAAFVFELNGPGGEKTVKNIAVARFWARVDEPSEAQRYLLYQAGKFFPMYSVDESDQTYTLLTKQRKPFVSRTKIGSSTTPAKSPQAAADESGAAQVEPSADSQPFAVATSQALQAPDAPQATAQSEHDAQPVALGMEPAATPEPSTPEAGFQHPELKATKTSQTVAGMRCRVVLEMVASEPAIEHCMANTARLRVAHRELITLARLFVQARKMNLGWLGIGTEDERFVSIQSRDLRENRRLELTSVSTKPLPVGHLRIPRSFKRVEVVAPKAAGEG